MNGFKSVPIHSMAYSYFKHTVVNRSIHGLEARQKSLFYVFVQFVHFHGFCTHCIFCITKQSSNSNILKGNCHELRMHLSKFVCGNMPGFLATFRSRNLLFCLELSLSPPKTRHMRAVLPCIDGRLESNLKSSGCLFQVKQFPFNPPLSFSFRSKQFLLIFLVVSSTARLSPKALPLRTKNSVLMSL